MHVHEDPIRSDVSLIWHCSYCFTNINLTEKGVRDTMWLHYKLTLLAYWIGEGMKGAITSCSIELIRGRCSFPLLPLSGSHRPDDRNRPTSGGAPKHSIIFSVLFENFY